MNKSVLPMSFDSLSLAKPAVKKPQLSETVQQESFAERLSQSQRELKKDKTLDAIDSKRREKTDVENPKARTATENSSHQKKHVKKEAVDKQQEPVSRPEASIKTEKENLKQTNHNPEASEQESSTEAITNSEITAEPTFTVNPISEAGLGLTETTPVESTSITTDTIAAAVPEAESLTGNFAQFQLDSETDQPLAETNQELITKGIDIKVLGENYLQGIDIRSEQKPLATDINGLAETFHLQEIVAVDSSEETATIPPVIIPFSPLPESKIPSAPSSALTSVPNIMADENGMDLPPELMVNNLEEESDDSLDGFAELTGEIKTEDKSTKADLFKSLLAQSQTEKTSLVAEKPTTPASPLVAPLTTAQVATANRLFVPQTQLGMNTANPNWGNAVGEKILWMANQQLSSADIRLDPPELGSLQVKVTVQQDQANITFISPHPQVRELLDQQVTRLREMFAEQGLNLGQVDIADKREQQSDQSDEESKSKSRFVSEESEETQVASISSLYLVDQFV
jgi:flagellar hook-length control protein FliK